MNAYQRFVANSLILSFVLLAFISTLLYIYDPFQLYHKPYFRETTFSNDMRVQNKGLIKNYDFDSFILGTSMLENTSAKEAGEKIGGKWVNISMAGSALNERAVILQYLLKTKEAKHIIYSIDAAMLFTDLNGSTESYGFLYDDDEFNDFKIYMNQKYISCALLFSSSTKCVGYKDLDSLISWAKKSESSANFGGFKNWLPNLAKFPHIQKTIDTLKETNTSLPFEIENFTDSIQANQIYIEKNLLQLVRNNPNTHFHLIFPSYSRLYYRTETLPHFYTKTKAILKWLILETQNLPNVKIYGFDDLDYADDIASYADPTHYNVDMNSIQLDAIANGTHILTPQNIDYYLTTMDNKIKNYDLNPLIQDIKEYEAKQKAKKG